MRDDIENIAVSEILNPSKKIEHPAAFKNIAIAAVLETGGEISRSFSNITLVCALILAAKSDNIEQAGFIITMGIIISTLLNHASHKLSGNSNSLFTETTNKVRRDLLTRLNESALNTKLA